MKIAGLETNSKFLELEYRLTKYSYLSKKTLPAHADALVYLKLHKANSNSFDISEMPPKEKYFNFYHWYILMSQFALREIEILAILSI